MSGSSIPRIVRKHKPKKRYTAHTARKAFPLLMEDFFERCAYSLVHRLSIGDSAMNVDHFDPSKKRVCFYENLYPACSLCNNAKGDAWPSPEDQELGARFLDPCRESDYGYQIFENPETHELVGTTTAARYHIDMLDLNNEALVAQRRERTAWISVVNSPVIELRSSPEHDTECLRLLQVAREHAERKIPSIPPPPAAKPEA
ncbi:MAG: hypothetical protein ACREIA_16565 [Opitutaceae bacterium]